MNAAPAPAAAPPPGRRVGLFGGTFDPVHVAHVALGHAALDALDLDEVRWVPSGQSWQKSHVLTPAAKREAMVRLAIAGEPRFVLDRIEIERPGPSYTLDTVRQLQAAWPGRSWVLVLGQDQYGGLHTWQNWRELLSRVTLAVANRPGPAAEPAPEVRAFEHRVVPLPMLDISSTDIRARVAAGTDIAQLVPPGVARYIEQHGLYRAAPTA
jgi:nicotinate-nucleotide adenylyltransferase